ncbi:hypothetical protein HG535_0F04190 [Zygotorulaspora mrakii]|uniref:Transcriptional adapter 3 n=1 Tax=Zygotorulaspora mrakii TaxID=42260 RepID=A0A7H9B5U0_ZYGMR|nr:uncharacterized protein HG535_0F04190 [Zygotorulaspora mrakii]QLG73907.1 hypothetical protein HG535_0F04190 [Zygotorulaspora mrakii]
MPQKIARRGKGPRDQAHREENVVEPPSKLLSSILKTLNLTFERDIGMLNGKNVRNILNKSALLDLQSQLERLRSSVEAIANSDQQTIETLRKIRDGQRDLAQKEEKSNAKEENNDVVPHYLSQKNSIADTSESNATPVAAANDTNTKDEQEHLAPSSNDEGESKDQPPISKRKRRSFHNDEDEDDIFDEVNDVKENTEEITTKKKLKTDSQDGADIDKMENDPSVKNPKSEFVVSQTLPLAAAALGLFNEKGLKNTGEDYLKKKYDVASYPTDNLKDLLPGEPPDMDFSHPKPTNQIQFNTFLSSVESIFRELNDDDIKFLKNKYIMPLNLQVDKTYDPEITPYIVPKLGPLYAETWLKEDNHQNMANISPPPLNDPTSILPRKNASEINDATLETEDISCGPFVSRLLSAIMRDEGKPERNSDNGNNGSNGDHSVEVKEENAQSLPKNPAPDDAAIHDTSVSVETANTPMSEIDEPSKNLYRGTTSSLPNPQLWKFNSVNIDYPTFEERLKRELKFVGIYINLPKDENNPNGDDPDWLTGREDDEISAELRELQNSLKQVTTKNQKRKAALVSLVERRLAWQEYSSILDDLDKQVDQAYIKRIRVPKKRKKHHTSGSSMVVNSTSSQAAQQKAANSSLKALLDKRQRWISKIGPLFDRPEIMKRMPKESVFKDIDQEEEEEETDVFGQNGNGEKDELTDT